MTRKRIILISVFLALVAFLAWRFLRPMNIFIVAEDFERPMVISDLPAPLKGLGSRECAACHLDIYEEWSSSIHSQAWTDPYFQVDFRFDGSQQVCKNCHIPLAEQQEELVLGFHDEEKWDPILKPNPRFDPELQKEGVNCAVCHVRDGYILGPTGAAGAPHPVKKMGDSSQVCVKCHVVKGDRWDTFFRFPPCGTVAEIEASGEQEPLKCVECHMPRIDRKIVAEGKIRQSRRHWWRGGHDREMVKSALKADFARQSGGKSGGGRFTLTLTNVGAAHYLPTGTPDRFLKVILKVFGQDGELVKEESHKLVRTIMWRPFIVDLWDTRLPRGEPRSFSIEAPGKNGGKGAVEAIVEYHLLGEQRRKRINYNNTEPISFQIFQERINY